MNTTSYICFDLETTGLNPSRDQILEIGAVKLDSQGVVFESFDMLASPSIPIPTAATRVHGIDASAVHGCPSPARVVKEFMHWVPTGALLIAHNAPYDAAFLLSAIEWRDREFKRTRVLDTLAWSRNQLPGLDNHKLVTLANYFGIDKGTSHRAHSDALTVAQLFCHLHRLSVSPSGAIQAFSKPLKESAKFYSMSPPQFTGRQLQGAATERQLDYLIALGASDRQLAGISKQQASELIGKLLGQSKEPASSTRMAVGVCLLVLGIILSLFTMAVISNGSVSDAPPAPPVHEPSIMRPPSMATESRAQIDPDHRVENISLHEGMAFEEVVRMLGPTYNEVSKIESPGRPTLTTLEWTMPDGGTLRARFEADWLDSWQMR